MIMWKNTLSAEILKIKRGCFFWVHVLIPLIAAIVMMLYFRLSTISMETKFSIYTTMVAAAFPVMISIVTSINLQIEEENNFYYLLSSTNRNAVLLSKLTVMFCMGCFSAGIALLSFYIFMGKSFSLGLFVELFAVICITNMILYIVHCFLYLQFGKVVSIFAGCCGTMIALLFLTKLGDRIWKYVPCSTGTRGTNLIILLNAYGQPSYGQSRQLYINDFRGFPLVCVLETLIIGILFLLWLPRWEGRKMYE